MAAIQIVDGLSSRPKPAEGDRPAYRGFLVLGLLGASVLLALVPAVIAAWSIVDSAGLDRLYRAESAAAGPFVHAVQAAASGAAWFALLWFRAGAGR